MPAMTKKDAWLYAASWGSAMTGGDPGACLYGFDESFRVQSEAHRADCLAEMERNRAYVQAHAADYDADELEQIDSLVAALKAAKLESEPGALDDCDAFTRAYVGALLFTDSATGCDSAKEFEAAQEEGGAGGNFPDGCTAEDFAPATLDAIKHDCARFQANAAPLLAAAYSRPGYGGAEQAGHDFWLTRNGHGVGFWDRSALDHTGEESDTYERHSAEMDAAGHGTQAWTDAKAKRDAIGPNLGERLSEVARTFGEVDSYFGDDGRVHI